MGVKKAFPPTAIPTLISIVMLLAGIPQFFPYGYYTLLRLVVCGTSAYIAYFSFEEARKIIGAISILFAFIFNPLIPLYLGKEIWALIDIIAALFFAITIFVLRFESKPIGKNKKKFVVLTRSVKHGQYCVAGREIQEHNPGLTVGQWIRPVSDHDEGAVNFLEIMLESGGLPQFLDIVEIEVKRNVHNQTQPENWLFEKKKWKRTGRVRVSSIFSHFVENPPNLWASAHCQPDRINTNEYITNGYDSSLCIIKPDTFVMEISTVINHFEGGNQRKKRRGKFRYNGVNYDLAITDPEIDNKYFRPFPRIDDGIKRIPMDTAKCLLCISLASQFNGYHYKLIAKVIENE